jgi:cytochrome d ubiquinol oxidase subunit I
MRTEDAVTGASGIPVGYGVLVIVYAGCGAAVWWILRRLAGKPFPERPSQVPEEVGTT